jgi:epidermal growth factor receptor substrate 15
MLILICLALKNLETISSNDLNKPGCLHIIQSFSLLIRSQNAIGVALVLFSLLPQLFFSGSINAQGNFKSEAELKAYADGLFAEQKFTEALPSYSQLLSLHPTSAEYNYKYGACMLYGDANKEKSFQHLRYAIGKPGVPPEVHFYLGKAYHLNYLFADAIEQFEKYKSLAVGKKDTKIDVELALQQCRNGKTLLSRVKDISVLDKVEVRAADFFRSYDLDDIGGRIIVCPEELLTPYDKKTGERFLMYFPGNTTTVFFSSYGKDGSRGRDIFRATRTPSGGWSKPIAMSNINTPYDDNFPFLHPDGTTFYFSSKGHSSMGGYDIFRCEYNEGSDTFTSPENLDFAINTPDDDVFFITDKDNNLAYFASGRSSAQDYMHVYRVKVAANPVQLVFIKGVFESDIASVGKDVQIIVQDANTNVEVGQYASNSNTGEYVIDLPKSGRYKFTVNAKGAQKTHTEIVDVPSRAEMAAYGQTMNLSLVNTIEKLIINSRFDSPLQEDLYALAQGVLKYRAGLDVNSSAESAMRPAPKDGSLSGAFKDAGFAENLSNDEVLRIAEKRATDLEKKGEEMRKQMNYAFTLAQQKKDKASKEVKDAGDLVRLADAVGDEQISKKYWIQSAAAKQRAEKLSSEAATALNLSRQLNDRLAEIEQEEQLAEAQAGALKKALASNEYDPVFDALRAIKQTQELENTSKNANADEYLLLRQKSNDQQKSAEVASRMAQDLRNEEQTLRSRIKSREQQMEAAKLKDRPAIQMEIDVLQQDLTGVETQIKTLFVDVEAAQKNASTMVGQAELYRKIAEGNTDTYIPEEKLITYREEDVAKIENSIREVEIETAGMKDNLDVVQRILVEDSNLALEAFGTPDALAVYTQEKKLDAPVTSKNQIVQTPAQRIEAAEDWINIINESVATLEAERKTTNNSTQRAEIDRQLAEYQSLKYKKVAEIDEARAELEVAETTPQKQATGDVSTTKTPAASVSQPDKLLAAVDPQYEARLQNLQESNLKSSEKQKRKIELDKEFITVLDAKIAQAEAIRPAPGTEAGDQLELMKLLKKQKIEDVAFEEDLLARADSDAPARTSTEILMEAYGIEPKEEPVKSKSEPKPTTQASSKEPVAEVNRPEIPESIDYEDIDPGYRNEMRKLERAGLDREVSLRQHNELNKSFIKKIDAQIAEYNKLEKSEDPIVQRGAQQARSQLNMIRQVTENEITLNNRELDQLQAGSFAKENVLITQEVDSEYVESYLAIEELDDNDYMKTISKARLEQKTVAKIDSHIAELVKEMDSTSSGEEKEAIQEKIQTFQAVRSEKVVAYESLYAKADQITKGEEAAAQQVVAETKRESIDSAPGTAPTETESAVAVESSIPQETPVYDYNSALKAGVATNSFGLDKLNEYTVFGEVSEVRYKSLNASLDYETVGSDLKRHHDRLKVFAATNRDKQLDDRSQKEYEELLLNEVRLQKTVADANRKEIDFYQTGNLQMVRNLEVKENADQFDALFKRIETEKQQAESFAKNAADKRRQAEDTRDIASKLRLSREAFDLEVKAIETYSKSHDLLNVAAKQGLNVASNYQPQKAVVAVIPQLETEPAPVAQTPVVKEEITPPVATTPVAEIQESNAEFIAFSSPQVLNKSLKEKYSLSDGSVAAINANPLYLEWFRSSLAADSLESIKRTKIRQAEYSLDEAERKLVESEKLAAEAEQEEDEEKQRQLNDRAARLQMEAQELYRLAQKLKQEIDQYNSAASDSRMQADIVLSRLSEKDAREMQEMIGTADVATQTAENLTPVREVPREESPSTPQVVREETVAVEQRQTAPARETQAASTTPAQQVAQTPKPSPGSSSTEMVNLILTGELPKVVTRDLFEQRDAPVYSANNPIPVSSAWPDGLIFAVQVGAFRNPIPQDLFKGFTPIRGELLNNGITRYTAGIFLNFDNANGAKNDIREMGYADAFVVAYLDGQRIPLNRALNQQQASEIIAQAVPSTRVTQQAANTQTTQQSERTTTQPTTTPAQSDVAQSSTERESQSSTTTTPTAPTTTPGTSPATTPVTTAAEERDRQVVNELVSKPFVADPQKASYYNESDAAPAVQVEMVKGLFFTVQVGVYSKPVSASQIFNISPLNSEQTANGQIRYTSGMFPSVELAQTQKQYVVNAGVSDAFITAYFNGNRISVAQARVLLQTEGDAVLAGSPKTEVVVPALSETPRQERQPEPTPAKVETPTPVTPAAPVNPLIADIRFVVDLGVFGEGMPQEVADAILQMPEAGIKRVQMADGKMHYLSEPNVSYGAADALIFELEAIGVVGAEIKAMARGQEIDLEKARQITGQ